MTEKAPERMPDKLPVKLVDNPRSVCDGMYIAAARGTEYIRADLHKALTAERDALAAEVERLREALIRIEDLTSHNMGMSDRDERVVNEQARAALEEGKDG